MTRLIPSLWYAERAEEAARFYAGIIPESRIDRVWTMQAPSPSGPPGSVRLVEFTLAGSPVTAMEAANPPGRFDESVSLTVEVETQDELDRIWDALLDGGEAQACGWLIDRYGLRWQIVPRQLMAMMADPDPAAAARTAQAMMSMVKFDIAALEAAHAGRAGAAG